MPQGTELMLIAVGAGFAILGVICLLWGRHEERSYFDELAARPDLREFMSHWPERPWTGALKTGGWVAIALGIALVIVGIVFWLTGMSLT